MTADQQIKSLVSELYKLCNENGYGDPFSYARPKEIVAAISLGHTIAKTFSGADAFSSKGEPLEYKSTTGVTIKGSYTGVSNKPTWSEQMQYLKEEKIAKYAKHYYNRFDKQTGELVESWEVDGRDVYNILLPKFKIDYERKALKTYADPRLSATISQKEIKKYGKRII